MPLKYLNYVMPKWPKQIGVAVLLVMFVFLSLTATAAWRAWRAYHITLEQTQLNAANLAHSLSQHIEDAIKLSDAVLTSTVERVEADGTGKASLERLHALFRQQVSEFPQFHGMFLFDEKGKYLASAQPTLPRNLNILDRDYFKFHQQSRERKAYIGPPVRSKTTGEWMVTVSKRVNHQDGSFAGVASATIHMDYFRRFHDSFNIGNEGVVLIAFRNGVILTRRPFIESLIGTTIKNSAANLRDFAATSPGAFTIASPVDNVERIYSYRYLKRYPLFAAIGFSKYEVLADWRKDMLTYSLGLLIIAIVLMLLGWRLIKEIKLGIASEKKLIQTQAFLKRVNKTLEELALHDPLTGIANRRHFDTVMVSEFKRAKRAGTPLSIMMIDVDYFKAYNDSYGHPAGDECLKVIAETLSEVIGRAGDLVARYGGEEFAALFPNTDQVSTKAIAERICSAIKSLKMPHAGSPNQHITISVGIATFSANHQVREGKIRNAYDVIKMADTALYLSKRRGRNQFCTFEDSLREMENL